MEPEWQLAVAKGEVVPRGSRPKKLRAQPFSDGKRSDSSKCGMVAVGFFEGLCFEGLCDISVEIISRITVAFTLEKAFSNTSMNIYCVYIIVPFEHAVCSIAMSVYQRTHEQKTQKAHTHKLFCESASPLTQRIHVPKNQVSMYKCRQIYC